MACSASWLIRNSILRNRVWRNCSAQSCNGRIPAKGNRTIYMGYQNERVRYNNNVWLEAVSAVPNNEYLKTEYTVR